MPSKNNWILFLRKASIHDKYKGFESIEFCSLTYYYTRRGIRVFKISIPTGIAVYNAHFFTRYNERMNLSLIHPLDKVKHYFLNNANAMVKLKEQGDQFNLIGRCRDGFLLGNYNKNNHWLIYKTFISNKMAENKQAETSNEIMNSLQQQIENELMNDEFDRDHYNLLCNVYKSIC